ncbi:phage regulatory protein [Lactobacillus acidophilus]|uniref:Rha family transcriptional regulator n=1 Tax=Lactobacillus acidophilus TaxID=1579 RepID=UPI0021A90FC9|nr:Rha family transcriptional regulator [Lactobacillus acidophilus]MCT3603199.1 phage regulatory protein [Lactobacillus acidophilus]MCT3624182.1 phage regulatory protein [Lactobacillus acidophilus]
MNELVIMHDQQAVTTSLKVAESFSKNHADVMRSIRNLTQQNCRVKNMFAESTYVNRRGQEQPMYYMNRDGFSLLVMGFTGGVALQFKLKYIEAFNKMDEMIKEQSLPQTPEEQLALTMQVANRLVGRVDKVEKDIAYIKDTAEVDEQQRYQLLQERKKQVMKACGGSDSNFYRENKGKKVFAEFGRDFKKMFQIPRYDCLKKKNFDEAIKFTKQ